MTLASAAPAFAASPGTSGSICRIFYGDGTVNAQRMEVRLRLSGNYLLNTPYTWTFTSSNPLPLPSLVTGSWFTMTATQVNANTVTISVTLSTAPTTNPYCGSLAVNWDPGTQVLTPNSTITVTSAVKGLP